MLNFLNVFTRKLAEGKYLFRNELWVLIGDKGDIFPGVGAVGGGVFLSVEVVHMVSDRYQHLTEILQTFPDLPHFPTLPCHPILQLQEQQVIECFK